MAGSAFDTWAVAFLDLLGWTSLVDAADSDEEVRQKIRSIVNLLESRLEGWGSQEATFVAQDAKPEYLFVSDSIVISAPLTGYRNDQTDYEGLSVVVMRCIQVAQCVLEMGVLVRGGISVGPLWADARHVIGSAFNRAVEIEELTAMPRIELSAQAADRWSSAGKVGDMCLEHQDRLIVNTLHDAYIRDLHIHGGLKATYLRYEQIIDRVRASPLPAPALEKWNWLREFLRERVDHANAVGRFAADR